MPIKRPASASNQVNTVGGKDLILKSQLNHYKAISNAKTKIFIQEPHRQIGTNKKKDSNQKDKEDNFNIRCTYKAVSSVKPLIDSSKPYTFDFGKSKGANVNKFEDMEHIRRLNAMSKRILCLGKVNFNIYKKTHERKKNINDPIANPAYFFRKPGDDKAIKLVSLDKFTEKLNKLVK